MIIFRNITWKNLLSTGNNPITIQLDRSPTTLIVGQNGAGKCLHRSTEVDIKCDDPESNKKLTNHFMTCNDEVKLTIEQITTFYNEYPECIGKLKANTRHGYKTIEYAEITAYNSDVIKIKVESNKEIMCSPDHLFFDGEKWKKCREYSIGDYVLTKSGKQKIISISLEPYKDDLYDLQIEEVKEFYANEFVSHNSTLLDALSFALFGKAHRDINKNQLINTINAKNLEVDVDFDIGSQKFKVIRGMKPNKFEIYQNGNMINQDSDSRDYQKYLEQSILKLNHKSFHQIVVLGSTSFIPFMQLSTSVRREVIEDLLDIQVFTKMNHLIKERNAKIKEEINDITYKYNTIQEKIVFQKKYINDITQINDEQIKEKQSRIAKLQNEIKDLQNDVCTHQDYIDQHQDGLNDSIRKLNKKKSNLLQYDAQFKVQISQLVKETKFYDENDICPSCTQKIDMDLRKSKQEIAKERAKNLSLGVENVAAEIQAVESNLEKFKELSDTIVKRNHMIFSINQIIQKLYSEIQNIEKSLNALSSTNDLVQAQSDLNESLLLKESIFEKRHKMNEQKTYNDAALEMLKDSGIKTKVIREYLPVMNTLINKYLSVLDFFILFHLDENFNEVIKSRHRDNFNYESFSEGEKMKIDLALLFTWRQIARMKNSTNTNLLILDEVGDSSLDADGISSIMSIISTLKDTNTFIISHRDALEEKLDSKIIFIKDQNFSKML